MNSIISVNLSKLIKTNGAKYIPIVFNNRTITSKKIHRPKPFPYETTKFRFPYTLFEDTEDRLNENSKIIIVDGPIAVGKTEFCKKLAQDLDMLFLPPANMDQLYIYEDGFDLRSLDDKWSNENLRSFDEKKFLKNPNHFHATIFQIRMLQLRFASYVRAVGHMLSTGQGVILQRSPYSDYTFIEAMSKVGYISKRQKDIYEELVRFTFPHLIKPHLIIYLDCPVSKVQENIKKRNIPYEVNSPVFNDAYLSAIEDAYKLDYLPKSETHSEILFYDWSDGGDHEVVVEDIERIDFNYDEFSDKLREWRLLTTSEWNRLRKKFADDDRSLITEFNVVERFDVPEIMYTGEDCKEMEEMFENIPSIRYPQGYNPEKDSVLFKLYKSPKLYKVRLDLPV